MLTVIFMTTDLPVTFLEKLAYGGKMLLVGMGMVFAVLAVLWLCLELMRVLFYDLPRKRKEITENAAKNNEGLSGTESVRTDTFLPENDDECEIVAVIAAAVAAAQSEAPGFHFRAVSFRKIH